MVRIIIKLDEVVNLFVGTRNDNKKIEVLQKLGIRVNEKSFKEDTRYRRQLKTIIRKKLAEGRLIIIS